MHLSVRRLAALALALGVCRTILAHDLPPAPEWIPQAYPSSQAHAPTPLPDRIVLTWNDDPTTTQSVSFRTDTSVLQAFGEIVRAGDHGPTMAEEARRIAARSVRFEAGETPFHQHTVVFEGLEPDTLYAYRVGDGVNWSPWAHFRTAAREAKPFRFIYFGDAQNDIRTHWTRVAHEAFREAPRAAFTLHAGDLINHGDADTEWGEWFGAPGWVNGSVPVIATPGNHEYKNRDGRKLSAFWRPQFAFPLNGPDGLGLDETVYYIDYQGVRIICLNSNEKQAEQVPWLRKVLAENPGRWSIVTFHHPLFSPAAERDNPELRRLWKPVFDAFRVDLVLTGHDHTYARSGVLSDAALRERGTVVGTENVTKGYNQVYDPAIGTVYVVSVSGPKMYAITDRSWARKMGENMQLFQVITVDGDTLHYEARTATNRLFDAFTLEKRPGKANRLVEAMPADSR